MKLNKFQLFFIALNEKFTETLYNIFSKDIKDMETSQINNRNEVLNSIANILLRNKITNEFMDLTMKDIVRENTSMGKLINKLFKDEIKNESNLLKKILFSTGKDRYYINSYLNSIGIDFNLKKVDSKKLEKIISVRIEGKTYSDRIWNNKNLVAKDLKKTIKDFLEGKISVNDIEKLIKKKYDSNYYNTKRLVNDQIARVQDGVNEEWFNEHGVEWVYYSATLDKRTCSDCGGYDGKVYKTSDDRPSLPKHVKCRCTYIGLPSKDWRPTSRLDGDLNEVIGYKNYKEWYNEKYPIDFIKWDNKRGDRKFKFETGNLRNAKIRDIKKAEKFLKDNGMGLVIGDMEALKQHGGGFNPSEGQIYLPNNPTYLAVRHEIYHAQQYAVLGKEKYMSQIRSEREEHVYNQIMKHKDEFTSDEIWNAQAYIYEIRTGLEAPPGWSGFED